MSHRLYALMLLLVGCGLFYGAIMGTFSGLLPGHGRQIIYSAVKVPLLLLVTFALCIPSFFVVNTVAGLRDDFILALRALVATQTCVTVTLAGLAPLTVFWYLSSSHYQAAVLCNTIMFGIASLSAQLVLWRYYQPLIQRDARHKQLVVAWFVLYVFVGIQMGWVLRPFIGAPHAEVTFFREDAWGNAYVTLGRIVLQALGF